VNFNLYLDRDAAARLTRLAKSKKTPRNALIREAVQDWLKRENQQWPAEVLEFHGAADAVPFESHRSELSRLADDPFSLGSPATRRPAKLRGPRVGRK
jgi:predicted transcriptional regulator